MKYTKWLLLLVFASNLFIAVDSFAQRGMGRMGGCGRGNPCCRAYNSPKTVEVIGGEVISVDENIQGKGGGYGIHLTVKTDGETVTVHLGPEWYIENQDIQIEEADKIEITGSKIFYDGKPAITAYEVKKGEDTLVLRDANGFPAWRGWRRLPDNQPTERQEMKWESRGGRECGNAGCRMHNPEMKEKLEKAVVDLKREIKIDVKIENGGAITGNVECKRVRYPENVVVSIEKVGDNIYPATEEHGIIDQFNMTFVPHVLAVQKGTTVDFLNSDSVRHNVFSTPDCCQQFNVGAYDVGVVKTVEFNEVCEIPLLCNLHAEMSAYVVILDNPYFTVTLKDGNFKIDNIPPGEYTLKAWHEKFKSVTQEIKVETGKTTDVSFVLKKKK